MGKYKHLRKEMKNLRRRVMKLEQLSNVNSFCFGPGLTFPDYVKRTEKIINRLADCNKKGD